MDALDDTARANEETAAFIRRRLARVRNHVIECLANDLHS
jgi:hypothetical protein